MYKDRLLFELGRLKKELSLVDSPVGVQLPEGLKQYSTLVLDELREFDPILFVDPMFGACDLRDEDALKFGCKLLIHFGHASMGKQRLKTLFVPITYFFSDEEFVFLIDEISNLGFSEVNLVTTVNFLEQLPKIVSVLKERGVSVLGSKSTSHIQENHVLGCDSSSVVDKTKPVIYVGDGDFHPNNLGFIEEMVDVFVVNPLLREVKKLEINDLFRRQRYALVSRALKCNSFGIFVSSKHGQFRLRFAKFIKDKLEKLGKKVYIFGCDYVNEDYVTGVDVDCYVNTACPRIAYDDFANFKKPIITPQEVYLLEDINSELRVDQIRVLEDFFD